MKATPFPLLVFALTTFVSPSCSTAASAATTVETAYRVRERRAHETVWERVLWGTNEVGRAVAQTNTYVELASGLNFQNETTGQWEPSREEWLVYPEALVAVSGQTKVTVAHNLNQRSAVTVAGPDGVPLRSNPLGIGLFDPEDGKQVMLAQIKDCVPQHGAAPNEIIFRDCFEGARGSIRLLYTRAGFSQHFVLEQRLSLPPGFSDKTRVEFYTEFTPDTPDPAVTQRVLRQEKDPALRAAMVEPDFTDDRMSFGALQFAAGKAFALADGSSPSRIPVGKSFQTIEGGRRVLIESVEFEKLSPLLARLATVGRRGGRMYAVQKTRKLGQSSKQARVAPLKPALGGKQIQLAQATLSANAVVIDYEAVTSATNYTFKSDTTYFVTNTVNLSGTTRIEGGTVIKFATNASASLVLGGPLLCETGPYRPGILTTKDDDSVGESISGSSGTPSTNSAAVYLSDTYGNTQFKYLRFAYAGIAVNPMEFEPHFWNCQFVNCGFCVSYSALQGAPFLHNVLASRCGGIVYNDGCEEGIAMSAEHLTADNCGFLLNSGCGSNLERYSLTNCLITSTPLPATGGDPVGGFACLVSTNLGGIYQAVGAGSYYLAGGSTNRNAGTTNIDSALLAELKKKTTYPPVFYSNVTISVDTTLEPQAARDNDTPDFGYHYAALDFEFDKTIVTNANVQVSAGTAIATCGSYGIRLETGSGLLCEGTPVSPNYIARYNVVQERACTNYPGERTSITSGYLGPTAVVSFRFTVWMTAAQDASHFHGELNFNAQVSFRDCQFSGGSFYAALPYLNLTNCLFERVHTVFDASENHIWSLNVRNCSFYYGEIEMHQSLDGTWIFRDNLFDHAHIVQNEVGVDIDYSGYVTGSDRFDPGDTYYIVTNLTCQIGPLGNFYQPTNSGFINVGSVTNAALVGLYHFTTTTNQVKEANSRVDIGFHYVSVDSNGNPLDEDSDGLADYFEDSNGNGIYDSGTDWAHWYIGDTDGDGLTDSQEYQEHTNPKNQDSDGDGVIDQAFKVYIRQPKPL